MPLALRQRGCSSNISEFGQTLGRGMVIEYLAGWMGTRQPRVRFKSGVQAPAATTKASPAIGPCASVEDDRDRCRLAPGAMRARRPSPRTVADFDTAAF